MSTRMSVRMSTYTLMQMSMHMSVHVSEHEAERMSTRRYHKTNSGLELAIGDMKLKLHGLKKELASQKKIGDEVEAVLKR